jgi:hypothetical protein
MTTAMTTPATLMTAITQEAVPSPADSAYDGDPPAAALDAVTEL